MPVINHLTYVITVPKVETTFVRNDPISGREIRKIDINQLRLDLKAIEDTEEGITLPDTTNHNTEVTLGGVTYARTVEFLSPYSVEFEDGPYGVEFEGANTNLADVCVINQVSIRPNNSAGLIKKELTQADKADLAQAVWNEEL